MTSRPMSTPLTRADAYALARALTGLPWQDVPVTPLLGTLLQHIDLNTPLELQTLRRWLGSSVLRQVMAEDPNAPYLAPRSDEQRPVPELPSGVRLTARQAKEAAEVGRWLDDYLTWAGGAANETPVGFHEGAALYLAAVAIGRRLYIDTPWRQQVFPNLYLMMVAVSTYYRKSAGLSLAHELLRIAIPHMLMPQPGSPENFMAMLGGVMPANFDDMPDADQARLLKGGRFAAQRGILRDEISGLFKAMGRDYMSGMKELIMQLYDCPPYLDSNTNQRGIVVIRDAALSILGAATPAELATALSTSDWYNGNLARFALLTPEPDYAERGREPQKGDAAPLALRLKRLHERLPIPPLRTGRRTGELAWALVADLWEPCYRYEQALRSLTAPDSPLDDRLRSVYGRLHVQALKVALCLAALDWADGGAQGKPVVLAAHWYRAQGIAERWRLSAHRLLHHLGESEELRLESRILQLLRERPEGLSLRAIYRSLNSSRKPVAEAVQALEKDGRIVRIASLSGGGSRTPPDVFRLF